MSRDLDREWTQEELRAYLEPHGFTWTEGDKYGWIPQGCKYISFEPVTEEDIRRAKELADKYGWKL